jgi:hypothetical protein
MVRGGGAVARLSIPLTEDSELWDAWSLLQQPYEVDDAADEAEAVTRVEGFVHAWPHAPIPNFRTVPKTLAPGAAGDPRLSPLQPRHQRPARGCLHQAGSAQAHPVRLSADNFGARALLWCPPMAS